MFYSIKKYNALDFLTVYYFLCDSNKILAFLISIVAFLFFKNLKVKYNKYINTTAASTFGVLLIHANSDAMRQWLWVDLLHTPEMFYSEYLVLHAIGSALGVYIVCTFVDYLRIKYIEIPFLKKLDMYCESIKS